jgi:hypothetical protein
LPVVLYNYEIWSLKLREEFRLRVFENLRGIFGSKRDENGCGESSTTRNFVVCNIHPI